MENKTKIKSQNKLQKPKVIKDCSYYYDCCDCGGNDCGCAYCWSCNACECCLSEDTMCRCELLNR